MVASENPDKKIWLPSFVLIGWVDLNFQQRQGKICSVSVAAWSWPQVANMAAKIVLHAQIQHKTGRDYVYGI